MHKLDKHCAKGKKKSKMQRPTTQYMIPFR